ncbi:MAG: aldehyde ferredoxin oxidoreductase C-terminal domain-containing protein, partial [Anaerolineae bacterium]
GEREGLGDLLAEGSTLAAQKIGQGAEAYAINVKGQPFPMHEGRTRHGQALGYAVSPTGADHMHNIWDEGFARDPVGEGAYNVGVYEPISPTVLNAAKVRAYTNTANWTWLMNSLGLCVFIPWSDDQIIEMVRTITGWRVSKWELVKVGERGVTMARLFNLREGLTRADDTLPARMGNYHVSGTVNEKPVTPEVLDEAVTLFYGMMGWDPQTGVPTDGKLHELDIAWAR